MAETGIRTINLDPDDGNPAVEVLVHAMVGGQPKLRRQSLSVFVNAVLGAAGLTNLAEPAVLAVLYSRGFALGADNKLHLTQVEADLAAEIIRAKAAEKAEQDARILGDLASIRADSVRLSQHYRLGAVVSDNRRGILGSEYGPADYTSMSRGFLPPREVPDPYGFAICLANMDRIRIMRAFVYARPALQPDGAAAGFTYPALPGPNNPFDELLFSGQFEVDKLTEMHGSTVQQWVVFPCKLPPLKTDKVYFAVIEADDHAFAATGITVAYARDRHPAVDGAWKSAIKRATGEVVIPSALLSFVFLEKCPRDTAGTGTDMTAKVIVRGDYKRFHNDLVNGTYFKVDLPEAEIDIDPVPLKLSTPGELSSFYAAQAVSAPTQVNNEASTLIFTGWVALSRRNIENVVVTRSGTRLVEHVDYRLDKRLGKIRGLKDAASAAISVSFDWTLSRYVDLIVDEEAGFWQEIQGPARDVDPNENLPVTPGKRSWARIFVSRNQAELIPLWQWNGFARRGEEAALERRIAYNRARLTRTLQIARSGGALRMVPYGDSITAFGFGSNWYEPGGDRDTVSWLRYLPDDVYNTVKRYDGPQGANQHCKEAFHWHSARALEALGGIVDVQNMGIPGTTSRDEMAGAGPGGAYPQRLNAAVALRPHLVLLAFGMNQLGHPGTVSSMTTIIRAFQAAGAEVYVITPPRPAQNPLPLDWWLRTTRDIVEAAIACDAAYCDLSLVSGPGNEGCMGISPTTYCEMNGENHPGWFEYKFCGRYIALPFC